MRIDDRQIDLADLWILDTRRAGCTRRSDTPSLGADPAEPELGY